MLDALTANGCITSCSIEGDRVKPEWVQGGFEKAFEEIWSNPRPFGLKTKTERGWLFMLLSEKDKKAMTEGTWRGFKKRYGIERPPDSN